MCRIWDEDSRDRVSYYKSIGPMKNKKNGPQHRGKPYSTPLKQYGNRPNNQKIVAMGFAGGSGSKPNTFPTHITCYRCSKPGHISSNCPDKGITCFNCRQKGHCQRDCPHPKREQNGGGLNDQIGHPKANGRVFILNGAEALKSKDLIQGKLKLSVSSLNKDLEVETPTNGYVLTSKIDVILGMEWLSSNHVLLNCFDKTVVFDGPGVSKDMMFISANQVVTSLKGDAQVYMILSNLEIKTKVSMCDLPIVREFPEVFHEDIFGLPPERER
ncbi:uncharacterized protein [Glycine max]|uniref:uncharacterized protein n=1 Tax=Glycine max TaxID=3847 RepID=UPI0003DE94DA|nr:uncharacterized protein LOC112998563 [Glycine max]|eukprot:XP_025980462.1 uncharacterized protein LOC112998563 [Glycine max]